MINMAHLLFLPRGPGFFSIVMMAYTKDSVKGSAKLQPVCFDLHIFLRRGSMKSRLGLDSGM